MFGSKGRRLTEQLALAEAVAAERLDTIDDLRDRLDEVHRRLEAQRDETRRAYAESARLRMQREDLAEHLEHAVDERDALQVQVDSLTRDLIAVAEPKLILADRGTRANVCRRCLNFRRVGDDSDGGKPCPYCCCPDCGVVSGDGRPCASHGPTEDDAHNCDRCKGSRRLDIGEDHLGPLDTPCDVCCCYVCGEYTGGGLCEADKESAP